MTVIAYLKEQCGWSRGVREVLAKCGIEYEEKQIHIPDNYIEMVQKARKYIIAGDVIQVVPSQRIAKKTSATAHALPAKGLCLDEVKYKNTPYWDN